MNKNEFYKQLMSEYSFDADKIRENAKRGKNARQKLQPMYIGMSAAVAAMVVTVGSIAAVNLSGNNGVSLTDSGTATLSPSDRVIHALEQLEHERGSEESKDFYVTFSAPMSPAETQAVLAGTDIRQLYFADGTRVSDAAGIADVLSNGGATNITGAAVYCTGDMAATLQSSPSVFLIEAMSESDIQNAVPVNISEVDTAEVTLPEVVLPTEPTTPEPDSTTPALPTQEGTSEITDTSEMDGTAEPENPTEEMDGTAEPEATAEAVTDETVTTEPEPVPPPVETTPSTTAPTAPVTEEPTNETEQSQTLPEGVTLPSAPASASVNTFVLADNAFFMTSDVFYAKTDSSVALYRYSNGEAVLLDSAEINDPKIVWASENSSRLIISGASDYGTRGRMLYIDAASESITDLHTDDMIMSASLQSANYNAESRMLIVNIREDGRYYLIAAHVDGSSAEYLDTFAESDRRLTVAAVFGNTVYYTENSGGTSVLYAYNVQTGAERTVRTFDTTITISRNLAFTHAVMTSDDTGVVSIFDPETEKLIQVAEGGSVNFGASKHSFVSGGSVYTIAGGTAVNSGGLSVTASIDYRKSGSEKYAATVYGGYVRVGESIYSTSNKNSLMTFSDITESASGDIRKALDGAIGVNNALALGTVADSGITKPQTLVDCIKLYYSGSASDKLMNRCGISGLGALRYDNGGLSAINANDTALVISSESGSSASGTLYIKAGSFVGRTAFRSINVSFVKENGVWKLDSIL